MSASGSKCCVAIDLGADSCRVSIAEWTGTEARVRLVYRFANAPLERDGHLYWDLDRICREVELGIQRCAHTSTCAIDSLAIDGWAVDYVRLGETGEPLDNPFCYRDSRTETAMQEVWKRISPERLYEITGVQFLRFNTLYQLYADQRDGLQARRWLTIPEYISYRIGSTPVAEYTNATHSQLLDVQSRQWSDEIFEHVGLDRCAAPELVTPGSIIGELRSDLRSTSTLNTTRLIAPACHDTASAIAGISAPGYDWAFISSGTWSLVGAVLDAPHISESARLEGFSNEGGIAGRINFLKNVNGMWLLQECMREWQALGFEPDLPSIVAQCGKRPSQFRSFNVDAPELLLPGNMLERINRQIKLSGYRPFAITRDSMPLFAQTIFVSLAARYADVLRRLAALTNRRFRRLYIVGGGSRNEYLNYLVGERTGLQVIRGAAESSTIGNAAVQFAALERSGGLSATALGVTPARHCCQVTYAFEQTWASRS